MAAAELAGPGGPAGATGAGRRPSGYRQSWWHRRELVLSGRVPGRNAVGDAFAVEVGPVAHGGHCVARHEGRVVFVRHALPGETVEVVVTEGRDCSLFWRADAVAVVTPSVDRVEPPCRFAGPGRCGGCDWQHASVPAQRALKTAVVREQLVRLARLPEDSPALAVEVEAVPGDKEGLGWRTRVRYAVDAAGSAGFRQHRGHLVVPVDRCLIAHPLVESAGVARRSWPGVREVEVAASVGTGEHGVQADGSPPELTEILGERAFRVGPGGFWQVHPGAAEVLTAAVVEGLDPQPGERAMDLYGGVGLFAAALAQRVGAEGHVTVVESGRVAVQDARRNLAGFACVSVHRGRVEQVLARLRTDEAAGVTRADVVVLDPPRSGAGRAVVDQVVSLRPRRVAYVACDPAALARDLRSFGDRGYDVTSMRAFDLFPMTHHVECVAVLAPPIDDRAQQR